MRRYWLTFLVAAMLVFSGAAAAETQEEHDVPGRYDWSPITTLDTVPRSPELPPVKKDNSGNFHAFMLDTQSAVLNYVFIDNSGQVSSEKKFQLPHVTDETLLAAEPLEQGLLAVWVTPDDQGYWRLYACNLNLDGTTGPLIELSYDLTHPQQVIGEGVTILRTVFSLDVAVDSRGALHLSIHGGIPRDLRSLYLRFDSEFEFQLVQRVGAGVIVSPYRTPFSGGQIITDGDDNVLVLNDFAGRLRIDMFDAEGNHSVVNCGQAVYGLGAYGQSGPGGLYGSRRVGPVMAVDEDGVVHLAYNFLTKPPSLTPHIVDVAYAQIRDGAVVLEKIITNEQGVSHYPTITANNGKVYITWEETSGSTHELYYAVLNSQGEMLSNFNRLTWEQAYSRLGFIHADDQGHLHAFWWRPARDGQDRLAYKNTVNPMPQSIWLQLGLDPYDPDSTLTGQLFYYGIMTLIAGLANMVANLHIMLFVIAILFIIYKLQLLDFLLERPWSFYFILMVALYPFMPRIVATESAFSLTPGFYFFVWLTGVAVSGGVLLLFRIKPNSTLNLVLGCLIWMQASVLAQMLPVVPMSFAL